MKDVRGVLKLGTVKSGNPSEYEPYRRKPIREHPTDMSIQNRSVRCARGLERPENHANLVLSGSLVGPHRSEWAIRSDPRQRSPRNRTKTSSRALSHSNSAGFQPWLRDRLTDPVHRPGGGNPSNCRKDVPDALLGRSEIELSFMGHWLLGSPIDSERCLSPPDGARPPSLLT